MTTLALDLGTRLGWAVSFGKDASGKLDVLHGTVEFRTGRFEGGGMRWLRFRKWLDTMHEEHGPIEAVYFEEVRNHRGIDAAHSYGGFLAQITAWCEKREVPYQGVPVKTIKVSATGKGNANKAAVIEAMRKRGFSPEDDNAADAIALLLCVQAEKEAA